MNAKIRFLQRKTCVNFNFKIYHTQGKTPKPYNGRFIKACFTGNAENGLINVSKHGFVEKR